MIKIFVGDCRSVLKSMPAESVHCCVTSPPFWGLRDYGVEPSIWGGDASCRHDFSKEMLDRSRRSPGTQGSSLTGDGRYQATACRFEIKSNFCVLCGAWRGPFGLEPTYQLYVDHAVEIFREVWRVLRPEGQLWLNLGDSYATGAGKVGDHPGGGAQGAAWSSRAAPGSTAGAGRGVPRGGTNSKRPAMGKHEYIGGGIAIGPSSQPNRMPQPGLKPKDLCGIPWRVAFALQEDGWWLRQDIIWSKPNPMPESVTDRCTKAHEYLFLLSKSERYYFDQDAIREPFADTSLARLAQDVEAQTGSDRVPGKTNGPMKAAGNPSWKGSTFDGPRDLAVRPDTGRKRSSYRPGSASNMDGGEHIPKSDAGLPVNPAGRNKRSVWEIVTQPFALAHFATFPPALIEPCILAGCPKGALVLDPFGGAGTTALVCDRLGRDAILIELNPSYAELARRRLADDGGMFSSVAVEAAPVPEAAE